MKTQLYKIYGMQQKQFLEIHSGIQGLPQNTRSNRKQTNYKQTNKLQPERIRKRRTNKG